MRSNKAYVKNHIHVTCLYVFSIILFSILVYLNHYDLNIKNSSKYLLNYLFSTCVVFSLVGVGFLYVNKVGVLFLWWRFILSGVYLVYSSMIFIVLAENKFDYQIILVGKFVLVICLVFSLYLSVKNLIKIYDRRLDVLKNRKYTLNGGFDISKSYLNEFDASKNHTSNHNKSMTFPIVILTPIFVVIGSIFPVFENYFWLFCAFLLYLMSLVYLVISFIDLIFIKVITIFIPKNNEII